MIEHNGKQYARVTEVLTPFTNFGHIDPQVLAAKALIGTKVHEAIHELVTGTFPVIEGRALRYLQSFERWRELIKPEFVLSEERFFDDDLRITGAIDALVRLPGETELTLIDFKTAAVESPVTWPMQAHLYGRLCRRSGRSIGSISNRYLFLRLNDRMELPSVHVYQYQDNIMNRCLAAVADFWQLHDAPRL